MSNTKLITEKESIIWASGEFLTTHLPSNYTRWGDEKLNEFLEQNACELGGYDAEYIWEQIINLAISFQSTVNKKLKENENEISNAYFNSLDLQRTISSNGLDNLKRVHDGTENEDTIKDLIDDLVSFLTGILPEENNDE